MKIRFILLGAISLGLFLLAACGGEATPASGDGTPLPAVGSAGLSNPLAADSSAIEAGKTTFENICAACHGPEGKGDGPAASSLVPPPANLTELQSKVADDYLFGAISNGKEGTSMSSWKNILTEEQIWQVVAYLRTLK